MVVTQQNSLLPLSLHQRFDFGLIELDDLLRFVMDPTRQRHDEELPRLKDEIHATLDNRYYARKPSPCCPVQQMSTGGLDRQCDFRRVASRFMIGGYDSAEFFYLTGEERRMRAGSERQGPDSELRRTMVAVPTYSCALPNRSLIDQMPSLCQLHWMGP